MIQSKAVFLFLVFLTHQSLSSDNGLMTFLQQVEKIQLGQSFQRSIIIEADHSYLHPTSYESYRNTYNQVYPNGDFYYFIGILDDSWSKYDYSEFYVSAKRLTKFGFRVIVNPLAFISDAREAVQNPNTSAILWNGHGNINGWVRDNNDEKLPIDVFTAYRGNRLKYIFFANCYGEASARYYHLQNLDGFAGGAKGWTGRVTSSMLFDFLASREFKEQLSKALGITLKEKPQGDL